MERKYVFPKPQKLENGYYVFNDVTLPPFRFPYTCSNTVTSHCKRDLSVEECVAKCQQSEFCDAGYFLKPDGERSYCLPLYTNEEEDFNPIYNAIHKKDDGFIGDTAFFLNSRRYDYPDKKTFAVYYNDSLYLKQGKKAVVYDDWKTSEGVKLGTDPSKLEIYRPPERSGVSNILDRELVDVLRNYDKFFMGVNNKNILILSGSQKGDDQAGNVTEPVCIGDEDPGTCMKKGVNLAKENDLNSKYLRWIPEMLSPDLDSNYAFQIIVPDKKSGEIVEYGDQFYLTYGGNKIHIGSDGEKLRKNVSTLFVFEPAFSGYYCDENGTCQKIDLTKVDRKGLQGFYGAHEVYRDCMGLCSDFSATDTTYEYLTIILIALVIVVGLIFVQKKFKKNKH